MELSASLRPCITVGSVRFTVRTWLRWPRSEAGPPESRTQCCRACQGSSTPPGAGPPCHNGMPAVAFRVFGARRHPALAAISGLHTLPARSPVNASPTPLPTPAHDSGPAWLAGPSLSGTCTLQHSAGLSRRTRTPTPQPLPAIVRPRLWQGRPRRIVFSSLLWVTDSNAGFVSACFASSTGITGPSG